VGVLRCVQVSDFGLSSVQQQAASMTMAAEDYWTAPEVILGHDATVASDVYSFAIVFWELLACEIPFQQPGAKGRFIDWVPLVVEGTRPYVTDRAPAWCRAVIQASWGGNPRQRPSFAVIAEVCYQRDHADLGALVGAAPTVPSHVGAGVSLSPGHAAAEAAATTDGEGASPSHPSASAGAGSVGGSPSPSLAHTALGAAAQGTGPPAPTPTTTTASSPPSGGGLARGTSALRTVAVAAAAAASGLVSSPSRRKMRQGNDEVAMSAYASSGSMWTLGSSLRPQRHQTLEQNATVSSRKLQPSMVTDVIGAGGALAPPSPHGSSGQESPAGAGASAGAGGHAATASSSDDTLSSNPDRSVTSGATATVASALSWENGTHASSHTRAEPVAGIPMGLSQSAVDDALRDMMHGTPLHETLSRLGASSGILASSLAPTAAPSASMAHAARHSMPAALHVSTTSGGGAGRAPLAATASAPGSDMPTPLSASLSGESGGAPSPLSSEPSSTGNLLLDGGKVARRPTNPRKVHGQRLHSYFRGGEIVAPAAARPPRSVPEPVPVTALAAPRTSSTVAVVPMPTPMAATTAPGSMAASAEREARRRQIVAEARRYLGLVGSSGESDRDGDADASAMSGLRSDEDLGPSTTRTVGGGASEGMPAAAATQRPRMERQMTAPDLGKGRSMRFSLTTPADAAFAPPTNGPVSVTNGVRRSPKLKVEEVPGVHGAAAPAVAARHGPHAPAGYDAVSSGSDPDLVPSASAGSFTSNESNTSAAPPPPPPPPAAALAAKKKKKAMSKRNGSANGSTSQLKHAETAPTPAAHRATREPSTSSNRSFEDPSMEPVTTLPLRGSTDTDLGA
jgi:hypothetical protein